MGAALARLRPGELLISETLLDRNDVTAALEDVKDRLSPLPSARFDSRNGESRLLALYGVASLDGFGEFSRPEISAAGALLDYVDLTQKGRMPRIGVLNRYRADSAMKSIRPHGAISNSPGPFPARAEGRCSIVSTLRLRGRARGFSVIGSPRP